MFSPFHLSDDDQILKDFNGNFFSKKVIKIEKAVDFYFESYMDHNVVSKLSECKAFCF